MITSCREREREKPKCDFGSKLRFLLSVIFSESRYYISPRFRASLMCVCVCVYNRNVTGYRVFSRKVVLKKEVKELFNAVCMFSGYSTRDLRHQLT